MQTPVFDSQTLQSWQRSLAAVLCNPSKGDVAYIRHLGDSLLAAGDVYAAHACFLCANEAPRSAVDPHCRIALLGANHRSAGHDRLPLAIQLTEVLEYAKRLGGSTDVVPHFHYTKLMYAAWLAEVGELKHALAYCDTLARDLRDASPAQLAQYSLQYVVSLLALGERLRARDMLAALQSNISDFWVNEVC